MQDVLSELAVAGGEQVSINTEGLSMGVGKTQLTSEKAGFSAGNVGMSFNSSMFSDPNMSDVDKEQSSMSVKVREGIFVGIFIF
jgi:hypothetical protein